MSGPQEVRAGTANGATDQGSLGTVRDSWGTFLDQMVPTHRPFGRPGQGGTREVDTEVINKGIPFLPNPPEPVRLGACHTLLNTYLNLSCFAAHSCWPLAPLSTLLRL